jgi:hypothetical protein
MEITKAASILRPGTSWNHNGKDLIQADDGTPRVPVPAQAELDPIIKSDQYVENRVKEYPPIGDQLDAIWKGGVDSDNMKALIASIKTKYPKPG